MGDELSEYSKGVWLCVVCLVLPVACAAFLALLVVVDQRDELAEQLGRSNVRLEEARRLCKPQKHISCAPIGGGSSLVACSGPGSKFFWLAVESGAVEDL